MDGQVGRPKFDTKEETLIELRSLGFSWEGNAHMLLVSRWTIHQRVSEFGLNHLPRFSDVIDEQLDSKVSAFLREQSPQCPSVLISTSSLGLSKSHTVLGMVCIYLHCLAFLKPPRMSRC